MKQSLPVKIHIPDFFLEEEVRNGWTVTPLMKKVWAVEIDLLFEFKRICDKYNLKWYADAGTMIGAVRHNGFIPWDDDIDVFMFRNDYDIFCNVAKNEVESPYFYTNGTLDKGIFRAYSQIYNSETTLIMENSVGIKRSFNQGIFIDIFPIDNIPSTKNDLYKLTNEVEKRHQRCCWLFGHTGLYKPKKNESIKRRAIHYCASKIALFIWPFANKKWPFELHNIMCSYQNLETELVSDLSMVPFHEKRIWKREWFNSIVELPFEWFTINVPCGYEQWLTRHYGNWQKFEIGTSYHSAGIYDPEKPYTEYQKEYSNEISK